MTITTRQKRQNITTELPTFCIAEKPVEIVDSHRVLGVMIDNNIHGTATLIIGAKLFPRKYISFAESNTSLIHMLEDYFFIHIFSPVSVIAQHYLTLPVKMQQSL